MDYALGHSIITNLVDCGLNPSTPNKAKNDIQQLHHRPLAKIKYSHLFMTRGDAITIDAAVTTRIRRQERVQEV